DAQRPAPSLRGAERVDENRRREALDPLEQKRAVLARRALRHAIGDLGDLELAPDGHADSPQLVALLEEGEELAEVLKGHGGQRRICVVDVRAVPLSITSVRAPV